MMSLFKTASVPVRPSINTDLFKLDPCSGVSYHVAMTAPRMSSYV